MKKLILPVFVMLIGAGTAFASGTAKKSSSKALPVAGYIHNQTTGACEVAGECDSTGDQICTVGNVNPVTNPSAPRLYKAGCIELQFQTFRP